MKLRCFIGAIVFLVLAACQHPVGTVCTPSVPQQQELAVIDTMMQTRPDSALSLLLEKPMDNPYYQLLLSEALYKNDSAQLNRSELLAAVKYFDSVGSPFLSARAHYIKGVGYYEMDSVVLACQEYLKALEIMEEHYDEDELVGNKAKFMALAQTHLCVLFSDQFLHAQAIYFGKQSLPYYYKHDTEPWHIAWIFDELGLNYNMMEQLDSAAFYYIKALAILPDTNNITYRDITTARSLLSYNQQKEPQEPLKQLYCMLAMAESEQEYLSRCLVVGEIFFYELQYDSAWKYLNKVFDKSSVINSKKQAAELLAEICKYEGKNSETYANYLVPFANQEENKSEIKSQLAELYSAYIQKQLDNARQLRQKYYKKRMVGTVVGLTVLLAVGFAIYHKNRKHRHKTQIKALGGRLRESNEALEAEKKEKEKLLLQLNMQQRQKTWGSLDDFMNESICQEIIGLLQDVTIKRDAKSDYYSQLRLNENQLSQLTIAVEHHFHGFSEMLSMQYPRINGNEINQCMLSLLNLENVKIAALLHCDYSTIFKRSVKLKKAFGTDKSLQVYFRELVLKQ